MVILILGNSRRRIWPCVRRLNGERSAPSMRTGTMTAPVLSAIQAGAGIDLHQRPGDADPPLGEDHAGAALLDLGDQRLGGERIGGVQGEEVGQTVERLHPPALGDLGIDSEDRSLVEEGHQQGGVEERDVIDDDQHAIAQVKQMLVAAQLDAIGESQDAAQQGAPNGTAGHRLNFPAER